MDERDFIQFYLDEFDQAQYDAFVESFQIRGVEVIAFNDKKPAHVVFTLSFKQFKQLRKLLNETLQDVKGNYQTYFVTIINLFPIGAVSEITPENFESSIQQFEPMIRAITTQDRELLDTCVICEDRQLVQEQILCKVALDAQE